MTPIDITPRRGRTTARALNLVLEDVRRSPRETLRARRDRITRQKEARLAAAQGPRMPADRDDLIEHDANGMA